MTAKPEARRVLQLRISWAPPGFIISQIMNKTVVQPDYEARLEVQSFAAGFTGEIPTSCHSIRVRNLGTDVAYLKVGPTRFPISPGRSFGFGMEDPRIMLLEPWHLEVMGTVPEPEPAEGEEGGSGTGNEGGGFVVEEPDSENDGTETGAIGLVLVERMHLLKLR